MSSRQETLLAALQRKTPAAPVVATPKPVPAADPAPRRRIGKPVQFWMHEEDRKIVRELAAWLAGQGIRATDSMVIRAALRLSKPGGTLLEAYRQAAVLDGRLRSSRPGSAR